MHHHSPFYKVHLGRSNKRLKTSLTSHYEQLPTTHQPRRVEQLVSAFFSQPSLNGITKLTQSQFSCFLIRLSLSLLSCVERWLLDSEIGFRLWLISPLTVSAVRFGNTTSSTTWGVLIDFSMQKKDYATLTSKFTLRKILETRCVSIIVNNTSRNMEPCINLSFLSAGTCTFTNGVYL